MRRVLVRALVFVFVAVFTLPLQTAPLERLFRYKAIETPGDWDRSQLADRMNAALLSGAMFDHVVIEIDYVDEYVPHPAAIKRLEKTLEKYLPESMTYEIIVDDPIPRTEWDELYRSGSLRSDALVEKYIDHLPSRHEGREVVYILYAPSDLYRQGYLGHLSHWSFDKDGRAYRITGVSQFYEVLREQATLWVTTRRLDRAVLIHEFGHVLGLVSDPEHTAQVNHHCTNVRCNMGQARTKNIAYWALVGPFALRMPLEYCKKCRKDIADAKAEWARRLDLDADAAELWHQERERDAERALVERRLDEGRKAEAQKWLDRLESRIQAPVRGPAKSRAAWVARQLSSVSPQRALTFLERVSDAQSPFLLLRGDLKWQLGQVEEAEKLIESAYAEEKSEGARFRLVSFYNAQGRYLESWDVLSAIPRDRWSVQDGDLAQWSLEGAGRVREALMIAKSQSETGGPWSRANQLEAEARLARLDGDLKKSVKLARKYASRYGTSPAFQMELLTAHEQAFGRPDPRAVEQRQSSLERSKAELQSLVSQDDRSGSDWVIRVVSALGTQLDLEGDHLSKAERLELWDQIVPRLLEHYAESPEPQRALLQFTMRRATQLASALGRFEDGITILQSWQDSGYRPWFPSDVCLPADETRLTQRLGNGIDALRQSGEFREAFPHCFRESLAD